MTLPALQNFDNILGTLGRGSATIGGVTYTSDDPNSSIVVNSSHNLVFSNATSGTYTVSYKTADGAEFAPKDSSQPGLGSFAIYSNGSYRYYLLRDGVIVGESTFTTSQPARFDASTINPQALNIDEVRFVYTGVSFIIDDITFSAPSPAPNAAPTFTNLNGDSVTYVEGGAPVPLDASGNAVVTDTDSANFSGGRLSAFLTPTVAGDQLGLNLTGSSVALSAGLTTGSVVYVRDVAVGTLSTANRVGLEIDLNAAATAALVQVLVRNLTFSTDNTTNPSTNSRFVNVSLTDGDGGSATATVTATVTGVNDAPTLTATALNPSYVEAAPSVALFAGAAASTVESGQSFTQLTLTVSGAADGNLEVLRLDGVNLQLGHSGSYFGANSSILVTRQSATVTIVRLFPLSGRGSAAILQGIVNGMSYQDVSSNPTETNRTVTLTAVSDSGGTSNGGEDTTTLSIASTVSVRATPDAPPVANADRLYLSHGSTAVFPIAALIANDTASYERAVSLAAVGSSSEGAVSFDSAAGTLTIADTGAPTLSSAAFSYFVSDGVTPAQGSASITFLTPTAGADTLSAPTLAGQYSYIDGGAGADGITGGAGVDTLIGGYGADVLNGGQGDDVLYGNQDDDVVHGGEGNDRAYGGQGTDSLYGEQGNDLLQGNAGDDILNGGAGVNTLDGGDGIDTVSYADAASGVTVSLLLQGSAQATGMSSDTLVSIESLTGSAYADVLTGDANANVLTGGYGADMLSGGYGADVLYGNQDNDVLYGNQDNDVLYGGQGNDTLYGGQGDDMLYGNAGDDVLVGGAAGDTLTGGAGIDVFRYLTVADSAPTSFDVITDFETGVDKLDLRSLHTDGSDRFVIASSGGQTFVDVFLAGHGAPDLHVVLTGMDVLQATDVLWS